ncbi:hypothetical protein D3C87_511260 [compost metagenome]
MDMGVKSIQLKASSLIETLVSMVIILIVFGIGMLIFVNITKASKSEMYKNTNELMTSWSQQLEATGFDGNLTGEMLQDSILLIYEVSNLKEYEDRLRLVIYSKRIQDRKTTDSVVRYIERKTENEGQR